MTELSTQLTEFSNLFNAELNNIFPLPQGPEKRVVEAMAYSVQNGGKRLRPFLVSETAKLFNADTRQALHVGIALELLHTYSLIHDDLPAMDNDDLRRGKPTCHKQFDEATAILAGDGLLTYAFELCSHKDVHPDARIRCQLIQLLAKNAGAFTGMIAGQMLDISAEKFDLDLSADILINQIEQMKTGRLIRFAVEAGSILGNASIEQHNALMVYARKIGQTFQISDDILDVEGDQSLVGKTLHKDGSQNKLTFVSLYGLEKAKEIAHQLTQEAQTALTIFGSRAQTLSDLAQFILDRKK